MPEAATETKQIAIHCESLSKQYILENGKILKALDDVSLTIYKGSFTGIVGKNGCGKTTLLKILSGIIKPSSGKAQIYGKVLSILEVGTGFHPELNGMENVFMVAKQFGLGSASINGLQPAIIEFSEMGEFMDMPVKFYSQGMYLRLALATLLFLNADIYLFDEVIAVGDAAFQKKCFAKIREMHKHGATMVFVSHNFEQVASLCDSCLVFSHGRITASGSPEAAFNIYQESIGPGTKNSQLPVFKTLVEDHIRIVDFYLKPQKTISQIDQTKELEFMIYWQKIAANCEVCFHINILDEAGRVLINTANIYGKDKANLVESINTDTGEFLECCIIPAYFLNAGKYYVHLKASTYYDLHQHHQLVTETEAPLTFEISNYYNADMQQFWTYSPAPIRTMFEWSRSDASPSI